MIVTIERIEDAGPDRKARRLVFAGHVESILTSAAVVRSLGLTEGEDVDYEDLRARIASAAPEFARERALRVLGYRDRSQAELTRKLTDHGYDQDLVASLVERFVELGLVDDARFASLWARTRKSSGMGPQRIRRELAERGVSKELAESAVSDIFGDTDCVEQARASLRGRRAEDTRARDRLVRTLVRRGFTIGTALKAVDSDGEQEGN